MTTEPTPPPGTPPPPSQRNKILEWITTGVVAPIITFLITLLILGGGGFVIADKVAEVNFATLKRDVKTNAASNTAAQEKEARERKAGQAEIMKALEKLKDAQSDMSKKQAVMNNEVKNINKAVQANSEGIKDVKKQLMSLERRGRR